MRVLIPLPPPPPSLAQQIYLENGAIDECISFYQDIHMWNEAINLAQSRVSFFHVSVYYTRARANKLKCVFQLSIEVL